MANVLLATFVSDLNAVDGTVQISASDAAATVAAYNLQPNGGASAPTLSGLAAAPVGTGGSFAAGAYFWKVTGINVNGETVGSNEATATLVLNGSATLTWSALPSGITGVKVYRGTASGAENHLIATLGAVVTYTDTGTVGSVATIPSVNSASTLTYDEEGLWAAYRRGNGINDRKLSVDNSAQFRLGNY